MVIKPDKCVGPKETFLLRYTTEVWTLKQTIVHSFRPSNINYSTIALNVEDGKVLKPVHQLTMIYKYN